MSDASSMNISALDELRSCALDPHFRHLPSPAVGLEAGVAHLRCFSFPPHSWRPLLKDLHAFSAGSTSPGFTFSRQQASRWRSSFRVSLALLFHLAIASRTFRRSPVRPRFSLSLGLPRYSDKYSADCLEKSQV
jgi:hypothetical protein